MPTGTPNSVLSLRAKKNPTAEKLGAVSGVQTAQPLVVLPLGMNSKSSSGLSDGLRPTLIMRIDGWFAFLISSAALADCLIDHSMFDWPEAIQTSPTSTSARRISFFPFTISSCGPPAAGVASFTCHLPSAPALAVALASPSETVTSSPASAQPQTAASAFCWRTMWSPKIFGSRTSARTKPAGNSSMAAAAKQHIVLMEQFLTGVRKQKCVG